MLIILFQELFPFTGKLTTIERFEILKKEYNTYLQVTGPPEANVILSSVEGGYESKWEITSDWEDIGSMFQ